jgi:hypothetical protein
MALFCNAIVKAAHKIEIIISIFYDEAFVNNP